MAVIADLATLGIKIDDSDIDRATSRLRAFGGEGEAAGNAVAGGMGAAAKGAKGLGDANDGAAKSAGVHGLQLGRLNQELGTAIGRFTGTNTALTRLTAQVGGAIVGYQTLIPLLIAGAGAFLLYDKMTESVTKLHEAQDKATESLKAFVEAQTSGSLGKIATDVDLAGEALDRLNAKLADFASPSRDWSIGKGISVAASDLLDKLKSVTGFGTTVSQQAATQLKLVTEGEGALAGELARTTGAMQLQIDKQNGLIAIRSTALAMQQKYQGSALLLAESAILETEQTALLNNKIEYQQTLLTATTQQEIILAGKRKEGADKLAEIATATSLYNLQLKVQADLSERVAKIAATPYPGVSQLAVPLGPAITANVAAAQDHLNSLIGTIKAGVDPTVAWRAVMDDMGKSLGITGVAADKLSTLIEKDLFEAIDRLTSGGTLSFTTFFQGIERLSQHMVEQITKDMAQIAAAGKQASSGEKAAGIAAGAISIATTSGFAAYDIGGQSKNLAAGGLIGGLAGAASGGATGAAIGAAGGPFGALAGAAIGGVVGIAAGIFGAATAEKKAVDAFNDAQGKYIDSLAVFGSQAAQQYASIEKAFQDLEDAAAKAGKSVSAQAIAAKDAAEQLVKINVVSDLGQQENALNGAAGAYANALDDINKKYAQNMASVRALGLGEGGAAEATDIFNKSIQQLNASLTNSATDTLMSRLFSITGGSALPSGDPFAGITDPQALSALKNFSTYLDGLQAQKDALAAAAASDAEIADFQSKLLTVAQSSQQTMQSQLTTAQQASTALRNIQTTLDATRDSLKLSNLTTLSPAQQLAEAQRQFQALVAKALTGDQTAAGGLSGAANSYLTASRAYNASGVGYVSDYNTVQAALGAVDDQFGAAADVQDQILSVLQSSNAKLTAQITLLQQGNAQSQIQSLLDYVNKSAGDATTIARVVTQLHQLGYQLTRDVSDGGPYGAYYATSYTASLSTPGFASGGDHMGGLAWVGERGRELIATGPARIHTSAQLAVGSGDVVGAINRLERSINEKLSAHTRTVRELATRKR